MAFDIAGARTSGYSDAEIADFLASEAKFDAAAARQSGYSDAEIISHLAAAPKQSTVLGELKRGAKQFVSSTQTGLEALTAPEAAAKAGMERAQKISEEAGEGVSFAPVKEAYEKRGILSALGEAASQVPRAVAGMAPAAAATIAGTKAGALAGAAAAPVLGPFAPVGPIVGGLLGAGTALYGSMAGSNIERQAQEQAEAGKPISIDRPAAYGTAVGQTALEAVGTGAVLGKRLVKGVLGIADDAALATAQARQALIKEAERSALGATARGAARGATEIPVEIAQSVLERAQAGLDVMSPEAFNEYGEAAYQAGIGGGGLGALTGLPSRAQARAELTQIQPTAADAARQEAQQRILAARERERVKAEGETPIGAMGPYMQEQYGQLEQEKQQLMQGPQAPNVKERIAEITEQQKQMTIASITRGREEKAQQESEAKKAAASAFSQPEVRETPEGQGELFSQFEAPQARVQPEPAVAPPQAEVTTPPEQMELGLPVAQGTGWAQKELDLLKAGPKTPESRTRMEDLKGFLKEESDRSKALAARGYTAQGQGRLFTPTEMRESGLERGKEPLAAEPKTTTPKQMERAGQGAFKFEAPKAEAGITGTTQAAIEPLEPIAPVQPVSEAVPEPTLAPKRVVPPELQPVIDSLTAAGVRPETKTWAENGRNRPFLRKLVSMSVMAPEARQAARKALKLEEGSHKAEAFDALFPAPRVPAFEPAAGAGKPSVGIPSKPRPVAPAEPTTTGAGETVRRGVVPVGRTAPTPTAPEVAAKPALARPEQYWNDTAEAVGGKKPFSELTPAQRSAWREAVKEEDVGTLRSEYERIVAEKPVAQPSRAAEVKEARRKATEAEVKERRQAARPDEEALSLRGEERTKQVTDFEQTLRAALNKFGLKDIGLKLINGMTAEGSYAQKLIQIASDSANPIRTLRHEAIHALRELGFFTDAQWKSLSKMAKDKWIDQYLKQRNIDGKPLKAGEESRYDAYMREYNGDMEKITEEAVADAFADFDATKPPAGMVAAVVAKLRKLFQAIKSALTKVESPEQIFGKVEKGELKEGALAKQGEAKSIRGKGTEGLPTIGPKQDGNYLERIENIRRQIGDDYVAGRMTHEEFAQRMEETSDEYQKALMADQKLKQHSAAERLEEVFPGFYAIPVGTRVLATGPRHEEPTMGTVTGSTDIRVGEKAYKYPIVHFDGDSRPRRTGYNDIKEVFAPRVIKEEGDVRKSLRAPSPTEGLAAQSELMKEAPGAFKTAMKDVVRIFTETDDVSYVTRFRTEIADASASVVNRMNILFDGAVRDELTGITNPELLIRQAQDPEALFNAFVNTGGLEKDATTGQYIVTDNAGPGGSIADVLATIKNWSDAKGMDFKLGYAEASKMLEARRLDAMRQENVERKKKKQDLFPIHKLVQKDDRSPEEQIDAALRGLKANPEIQKVADLMDQQRAYMIDKLVDVGRISKETSQEWKDAAGYVPFDRVEDFFDKYSPKRTTGRGLSQLSSLPKFVGSTQREVGNVFDNHTKLMGWMLKQTIKQDAASTTLNLLADMGQARRLYGNKTSANNAGNVVRTYKKGQEEYFEVRSHWDAVAFTDAPEPKLTIVKLFAQVSNILRKIVTVMPPFVAKQVTDDIQRAFVQSGVRSPSRLIVPAVTNFLRIAGHEVVFGKDHEFTKDFAKKGLVGNIDYNASNPAETILFSMGYSKRGWLSELHHRLESITRASDLAMRKAIYDRTMAEENKNVGLATARAREFINFRRRGASKTIGLGVATVPFFNAYLQSSDLLLRSMVGRGSSNTEKAVAKRLFWTQAAKMTGFALIYALANSDDEEYQDQTLDERSNNWIIGGKKLPVPGDMAALFKVPVEALVQYMTRRGTEEEQLTNEVVRQVLGYAFEQYVGRVTPVPQAIRPVMEAFTNHSLLTGRPLVGTYQKGLPAEFQTTSSTSELAKAIAKYAFDDLGLELSPVIIDNTVRGYLGGVVPLMNMLVDQMVNPNKTDRPLSKYWFLSQYLTPEVPTGPKEEFYDLVNKVMPVKRALAQLEKTDIDAAMKYYEKNADKLKMAELVNKALQEIEQTRAYIKYLESANGAKSIPDSAERLKTKQDVERYENKNLEWVQAAKAQIFGKKE